MRHADQDACQDHIEGPGQNDSQGSARVPSSRDAAILGPVGEVEPERQAAAAAVVAEAVALALEAAAAEVAEAVLVTATAVTEAAGRAADAAEGARRARAVAAQAAAQSVAQEAVRTAGRVQARADLAAAQMQQAALLAADELAHSNADGTALDPGRMAELLAATVRAAAEAAALDATRAANAVAHAAAAAAAYVRQTVTAAEEAAESEVTATADAQRELATATAAAMALESDARAAGVAIAARDAATALYMSEIAAELSHDLRVPLSSIVASVEMLEDELQGHSDQTVAALLGRARRASDRMVRMLEQKMTTHALRKPSTMPEIDLAEIARHLVLDLADLLEPVGAVVEIGELPVVGADPDDMYSVLQNLINNSVKFARPGVPAIVRVSARRLVDRWRISVRDNGVGLPDESGLDVFSLFSRGTSAVTGHGIGLATVARIVATHGGRVGASPVETGAEIWFELPEDETVRSCMA